jgi:hypothetical protein
MLLLKVVHHHHIRSPHIAMDFGQIMIRLAFLQPATFIEVIGP